VRHSRFSNRPHAATAALPVQALGELYTVLVRKAHRSPRQARESKRQPPL
jgi:predicted nucleic acid-binding protein